MKPPSLNDDNDEKNYSFELLVDTMNEGFGIINLDKKFTYANRRLAEMLKLQPQDVVGREMMDFLDAENQRFWELKLAERAEGASSVYELTWKASDGSNVETIISGAPLYNTAGRFSGSFAVVTDVTKSKEMEQALREIQTSYSKIIEILPVSVVLMDLQGTLLFVNQHALELHGYHEKSSLLGRNITEFVAEEDRLKSEDHFAQLMKLGGVRNIEYRLLRKDGTKFYSLVDSALLYDHEGNPRGIVGVARNIDPIKNAEERIKHDEALFRATVESTMDGILAVDKQGNIIYMNRIFKKLFNFSENDLDPLNEEILNRLSFEQMEDSSYYYSRQEEIKSSADTSFDIVFMKDGRVFERYSKPLLVDDQEIGRVWSYHDVTEREQTELALRESEELYRSLVEQSFQGYMLLKPNPLEIIFTNRALSEVLGRSPEEIIGMDFNDIKSIVHHDDLALALKRVRELNDGDVPATTPIILRVKRPDGQYRLLETFGRRVMYKGDSLIQVTFIDVTDRKAAEKSIQTEKERAMLYLDLLSHDIRNIMQAIIGNAAIIAERTEDTHSQRFLHDITDSVERAQRLVSKVKSTERLASMPLHPVSLKTSVENSAKRIKNMHENIMITLEMEDGESMVIADAFLEHVIDNLLENAIIHNTNDSKHVWVKVTQNDNAFRISIMDNGTGIPERSRETLFDLTRRFGGVGLIQTKQIIDKYNGTITIFDRIEGQPNSGANIQITIPKASRPELDVT